jgi:hypothetical protein
MKKIISYLRNIFSFNNSKKIENKTDDVVNFSTTFVTNEVLKVEELIKVKETVETVAKVKETVETVAKVEETVETVAKVEEVKPIVEIEIKPKSTYRRPKKKNSTKK